MQEKKALHIRNRNCTRYDLNALVSCTPQLAQHIQRNKYGIETVDFTNPTTVKLLNQALLHHYYGIQHWSFPDHNLCPPIPGRADYLHYMADLLAQNNVGKIPLGSHIQCLDIGVGASCIYPILGVVEYDWQFIGSDIDPKSIALAQQIIESNKELQGKIVCRLQTNKRAIFDGIIKENEQIDLTICNPPFHATAADAQKGTSRKIKNLRLQKTLNFAGISNELVCDGGEYSFIQQMIAESKTYAHNCLWFSSLVSKESNLSSIYKMLQKNEVCETKTIELKTGNKTSRIVAWTYLSAKEKEQWQKNRW